MNNEEIKEILELFASTDENVMFCDIVELNSKQSHLLLDYITNLQNKIKDLEDTIVDKHECIEAQNDIITNLQKENQQLKELTKDKSYCENCEFKKDNEMYAQLKDEYEDIIEKAIEYMNNYNELVIPTANIKSLVLKEEYKKIIHILQGEDNEQ